MSRLKFPGPKDDDENLRRVLDISERDTDKRPALTNKSIAISYDICDGVNKILNPNRSSAKLYFEHKDILYPVRVVSVKPSGEHPGFVIVEGRDYLNRETWLEVGSHCTFTFSFA